MNSFAIVGGQLVTTAPIDFEQYFEYFVRIDFTDESGHAGFDTIHIMVDGANDPPEFGNLGGLDQISEAADTSAGIKVGNIFLFDDGVGTNNLFLTGADANLFEIVEGLSGPEVHLKAGVVLDFESNPTLDFTLNADDPSLRGSSDATLDVSIPVLFAPINGTPDADLLAGTPLADTINGLGGNDVIFAQGNDRLNGGTGNDNLVAGSGVTFLSGADGEDVYSLLGSATAATTTISDNTGIDTIEATQARSALVLDLSTGIGHVGQQQIVIEKPPAAAGLDVVFAQDVSGSAQNNVIVMQSLIGDIVTAIQSVNAVRGSASARSSTSRSSRSASQPKATTSIAPTRRSPRTAHRSPRPTIFSSRNSRATKRAATPRKASSRRCSRSRCAPPNSAGRRPTPPRWSSCSPTRRSTRPATSRPISIHWAVPDWATCLPMRSRTTTTPCSTSTRSIPRSSRCASCCSRRTSFRSSPCRTSAPASPTSTRCWSTCSVSARWCRCSPTAPTC